MPETTATNEPDNYPRTHAALHMTKHYTFIFLTLLLSACGMNRYYLDDTKQDRTFLFQKIQELSKKGLISERPILVIDGIEYVNPKKINLKSMKLSKSDIKNIELLKKEKGVKIFGNAGERGVLLITTKANSKSNSN
ncbi:hypothetical protein [Pedobacter sp. SYSU D00535]|uniref:hypothetical protein n=1 Tax=Pedobacter sp. SYSU D00535 TaxID=2810308 RepID=UPI001A956923|nr:hypothetical protein [Pedobacter sp. SYSU D00535]